MATVSVTGFRTQFPTAKNPLLDNLTDAEVQSALDEAVLIHNVRSLATYYCAAHLLVFDKSVADGSVPTTEITDRGAGPLRASYLTQAETGTEAFFTSSAYGRRFLTLEKRSPRASIGAMVVA